MKTCSAALVPHTHVGEKKHLKGSFVINIITKAYRWTNVPILKPFPGSLNVP